jgi:putative PIN family toxin of toxin-antitoxin system
MRVVLDTNVFVSGLFFTGPPYQILDAWRRRVLRLALSPQVLEEYQRVSHEMAEAFPQIDLAAPLALLETYATRCKPRTLPAPVCADPDDDKFLACALGARTRILVSGDRHLLAVDGYRGIRVLRPRQFVEAHLKKRLQQEVIKGVRRIAGRGGSKNALRKWE